jgi:hypothetical protein
MRSLMRWQFAALVVTLSFLVRILAAASDEPAAGNFDGPAELPRVLMATALRDTPAPGKVIRVKAGQDASEAVEKASCGDTIELQAGASFSRLYLPAKKCDDAHWIIIRTSTPDAKLPPEGTRLEPCYAGVTSLPGRPAFHCTSSENVLAKIEFDAKGGSGPVILASGANHYRLIGLEVTRAASSALIYNLIGPDKGPADHLIFDRMWIHGTAQNETVRGVMLSRIRYGAVIDSYLSDFHCVAKSGGCVDSQAVGGGLGDDPMGPYKIENNFLEGAGESILFGGGEATVTPTDIEIRRNHLFKPLTWFRGQAGFVGGLDGNPFIVKNLFEIKNAQRVLFEDNILENVWGGFTQTGFAVLLGPKNQAGRTANLCPACTVLDITIRYCAISHVASGFQIGNALSDKQGAAKDGGRYSIHDVVVDDIDGERYAGFGAFAQVSMTPGESAAPLLHDVHIDHVTAFPPQSVFIFGGPFADRKMSGFSVTNSIFTAGTRTLASTGGGPEKNCAAQAPKRAAEDVLRNCFSPYVFHHNVIVGGGGGWPKDNKTPGKLEEIGFSDHKNGNGGEYQLPASSKFKRAAADQKDVGADVAGIKEATKGVA